MCVLLHCCTARLQAVVAAGARVARPGEFTLRAFLNGRLDLAQVLALFQISHEVSKSIVWLIKVWS